MSGKTVLNRFIEKNPLAVMTRCAVGGLMDESLDLVFEENRSRQYEDTIKFSTVAMSVAEIALGTGDIDVELSPHASYELRAGVRIGGLPFDTFPGFEAAGVTGPGGRVEATIGAGEHELSIDLGIGELSISTTAGP